MSNWSEEEERGYCTGKEDRIEAERVAAFLDIRCHFVEVRRQVESGQLRSEHIRSSDIRSGPGRFMLGQVAIQVFTH